MPAGDGSALCHRAPSTAPRGLWLRGLFETSFEPLVLVDDTRRMVRVNGPAAELLGAERETILGRTIEDFTPSEHLVTLERLWARLMAQGALAARYDLRRDDDLRSWIAFRATRRIVPGLHLIAARELVRSGGSSWAASGAHTLTERELEVLQLVADGRSNRQVADVLVLSAGTVRTHLEHIYAKLAVSDRAAAVATALRCKLIT